MNPALAAALAEPDFGRVMLLAVSHADTIMRKYIWRGIRPSFSSQNELMVDGKSAKDFVNEALRRLCDGTRTYNATRNLLENLNSITDSLISSAKKTSDRTKVVDFVIESSEDSAPSDPISRAVSSDQAADTKLVADEVLANQEKCFQMVRASFDGDKDMQEYLDALSSGYFDLAEISTLTGIPVSTIYELRRKLKKYAPRLFGVTNYKELERMIYEGN